MAFALVGSAGAATQGATTTAVTPAWGTSENRTANNLLLCFASVTGSATLPTTPSGWSIGAQLAGTSCSATVYYKVAAGADAAPTIASITSGRIAAHLEEWSGGAAVSPLDRAGTASGTSSPTTATLAAANAAANELVAMVGADRRSVANSSNDTWTSNHGTPTLRASNNGTSSTDHYSHATLLSTSSASADTAIQTLSVTTNITGLAVAACSFKLPASQALTIPFLDAGAAVYAPSVAPTLALPALNAGAAVYAPTIAPGPVTTTLPLLAATGLDYPSQVHASGPVGFWRTAESAGATIVDDLGLNDGSYVGSPTLRQVTPAGFGVRFDGATQYGNVPLDLSAYDKASISFWLWQDAWTSDGSEHFMVEFPRGGVDGFWAPGPGGGFIVSVAPSSGNVRIGIGLTNTYWFDEFVPPAAGGWHHYLVTFDRAAPANTAFVDGVAQTLTAIDHSAFAYGLFNNDFLNLMARGPSGAFPSPVYFDAGRIGDVSVYAGVLLTAADALAQFNAAAWMVLYGPTLAQVDPTITLPFLDAGAAVYAPTLAAKFPFAAPFLDAGGAVFAPTLAAKLTFNAPFLSAAPAVFAPTLAAKFTFNAPFVDGGAATFAPSLAAKFTFNAPFLDAGAALYAPTVAAGAVGVTLGLVDVGAATYAPALAVGPIAVELAQLDASAELYEPTIALASGVDQTIIGPFLDGSPATYAPGLTFPAVSTALTLPLLVNGIDAFQAGAFQADAFQFGAAPVVYPPTLLSGGGFAPQAVAYGPVPVGAGSSSRSNGHASTPVLVGSASHPRPGR